MTSTDKAMLLLDYSTPLTLDAIWKEQVKQCIINHFNTGITFTDNSTQSTFVIH